MQLALRESAFVLGSNVNVEYNFLRGRISPLLRAGVGFHNSSDIDLYAGVTHAETDLAWNVGVGLRWNLTDHFILKLMGGLSWTELKDSDDLARLGEHRCGVLNLRFKPTFPSEFADDLIDNLLAWHVSTPNLIQPAPARRASVAADSNFR